MRARATPASRATRACSTSRVDDVGRHGGGGRSARPSTSSSSGPRRRSSTGLVDLLAARGIAAFGPTREVAQLEGSKAFAKEVMEAAGVPPRRGARSRTVEDGMAAIERYPVVLKFDGLAAGKGVVIAAGRGARRARRSRRSSSRSASAPGAWWSRRRSRARSSRCWRCATARRAVPMAPAQDYKRIFDGDAGPNTGGMGSYSPVPGIDRARAGGDRAHRSTSRWSTSCATAARPSTAASTPG